MRAPDSRSVRSLDGQTQPRLTLRDDVVLESCRAPGQLSEVMPQGRDYDALLDAWNGWHSTSPATRKMYERYVALSNEGARDIGFGDVSTMWKSRYDMPPDQFEPEMDRLWGQMKPLYEDLHCYVRGKLSEKYVGKVKNEGPIPAHVLGNMWAQEWGNIYPLVEPYPGEASLDVTAAIKKKGVTEKQLVEMGEDFFVSLGLKKLPPTFYTRSQLLKLFPRTEFQALVKRTHAERHGRVEGAPSLVGQKTRGMESALLHFLFKMGDERQHVAMGMRNKNGPGPLIANQGRMFGGMKDDNGHGRPYLGA